MSRRIRSTICSRRGLESSAGGLVDERPDGGLELGASADSRGRLGATPIDEPQAQLGGDRPGVVLGGGDVGMSAESRDLAPRGRPRQAS